MYSIHIRDDLEKLKKMQETKSLVVYVGRGIRTLSFLPIVFPQNSAIFANLCLTLNLFDLHKLELSM